jgi:hypothetical protein
MYRVRHPQDDKGRIAMRPYNLPRFSDLVDDGKRTQHCCVPTICVVVRVTGRGMPPPTIVPLLRYTGGFETRPYDVRR